jgi:hypothetical protein
VSIVIIVVIIVVVIDLIVIVIVAVAIDLVQLSAIFFRYVRCPIITFIAQSTFFELGVLALFGGRKYNRWG